jgi:hypothetical protein
MSDQDDFLRAKAERIKQRYGTQQQNSAPVIKISPLNEPKKEVADKPKVERKKRARSAPKKDIQNPIDFHLEELLQLQSPTCLERYRNVISLNYDLKLQEMKALSKREPQKRDIEWHLLCDEAMKNEMDHNMGLYREILMFQAGFVLEEGKKKNALALLLELCYIDMNGPYDAGLHGGSRFEPSRAGFSPGVLDLIKILSLNLNLKKEDLHKLFMNQNKFTQAPLPLDKAWELLEHRMISEKII